jgi:site-specific recombinase XerD
MRKYQGQRSHLGQPVTAYAPPVSELIDDYLLGYAANPEKTIRFYSDQLGRVFSGFLADEGVSEITEVDAPLLRRYLAREASPERLPRPLGPRSIRHRFQAVQRFLEWCVEQGYIDRNASALVRKPPLPQAIETGYEREEVKRMLRYVAHPNSPRSWIGLRNKAILLFLLDTGARADELLKLKLSEADFRSRKVLLHGKGRKDRLMPLGQKSIIALREYLAYRPQVPDEHVWLTLFGNPMNYDALRDMLRDLRELSGVPNIKPHRFRHTYATEHYRANRDLIAIQHALGHSQPETTVRYLRGLGLSFHQEAKFANPADWLTS